MGVYLRKAIRVGPLRFNLSKSGVGVSSGVRGFRVGQGPRGNYVHMGRGGLYYRKTITTGEPDAGKPRLKPKPQPTAPDLGQEALTEIKSGDIDQMVDASSEEIVSELNNKRKKIRIWPLVGIFGLSSALVTFQYTQSELLTLIIVITATIATLLASIKDSLRKTTVLFFDLEPEIESLYQNLLDAIDHLSTSAGKWHVEAEGQVKDKKRSAGASSVVRRRPISIGSSNAPYVKTNVSVRSIPTGTQTLYFFPDKVLVLESNRVGAVSYPNLKISADPTRFIEDSTVPRDAQIVGQTWKYVNKRGGPDKRFKDNRELPIALYEDIHLSSNTGLNERIQVSKAGAGSNLRDAISELSKAI